jgi:hypothetical protein
MSIIALAGKLIRAFLDVALLVLTLDPALVLAERGQRTCKEAR